MDWRDYCVEELSKHRCFSSAMHKKRFIEMLEIVQHEPFFTREICKCLFLAAWDRKYTDEMEDILEKLIEEEAMVTDGKRLSVLRRNRSTTPNEKAITRLAQDFLRHPGKTPDESCLIKLSKAWIPLGDCALQVSEILDRL